MSKSGKNKLVATTNGFTQVNGCDGLAFGLNVTKRQEAQS
jgi:hypothetical protein